MNAAIKSNAIDALAQLLLDAVRSPAARSRYLRVLRRYCKRYGLHARALHNAASLHLTGA